MLISISFIELSFYNNIIWSVKLVRFFQMYTVRSAHYEQALWSQLNNLHRVCIKLSSLIMKSLYYEHNIWSL